MVHKKGKMRQVLMFLLVALAFVAQLYAQQPRKPNILFILADDLGYGDLSCYGQRKFGTPNIDRLAREGLRFTSHYAGGAVCAPSRSALMTGQHTGRTRIRNNYALGRTRAALLPEDVTVAEVLKRAGYATGVVGKWGLGEAGTTGTPNRQGFDHWFGFLNQAEAHNHYPPHLWRDEKKVALDGKQYAQDLFTEDALAFIERNQAKPFFLYLAYTLPHSDLAVPEDSLKLFRGKYPEEPVTLEGKAVATPRALYAAMVSRLDRDVGRVLALLKRLKLDDDTLVIFTSDNGPPASHAPEFFGSAGAFRGLKGSLYEGGLRVPFIARWPGKIKANTTSDHVAAFWDFLPTAAELAGVAPPANIDGRSYLAALLGKKQAPDEFLYWEYNKKGSGWQAVRTGDWKAVRRRADAPLELYNLKTDVGERDNVAARHPDIIQRIEAYLKTARVESELFPLNAVIEGDEEDAPAGKPQGRP
jgi:arylsulfatase A